MHTKRSNWGQLGVLAVVLSACGGGEAPEGNGPDDGGTHRGPHVCAGTLDGTTATSFYEAARCLFDGAEAPQRDVASGVIEPARVAIVRGTVSDSQGAALLGVRVSVVRHPEYGYTFTDAAGEYALAVNGGEALTLRYEDDEKLPVQRRRLAEWQQFSVYPEVTLLEQSDTVREVDLTALMEPALADGASVEDESGSRTQAVLIRPGTEVTLHLPDGTEQTLDEFHLRTTEYTVGERGVSAMPGELPAASGYTYATEFSLDEARDAGATSVSFDPPVVSYVDNFLGFPAGTKVPAGYYDAELDQWKSGESGVVIVVLSVDGAQASLDVDGDGEADEGDALTEIGIDESELELIARRYEAGDSLWRVPLAHFSPWDFNWGFGPPADARAAEFSVEASGSLDCRTTVRGSIIGCEDQSLGEVVPLAGTPLSLHYQSERMPGRVDSQELLIRLSGVELPASLKRIELEVEVLGKVTVESFEPAPNLEYRYRWDGLDPWGRKWQGRQVAVVRVGYAYDGAYEETPGFGAPGSGVTITGSRTRQEITLWKEWRGSVGALHAGPLGLGGWTLDVHHLYDPRGRVLYLGSGQQRSAEGLGAYVTTVAGTGEDGSSGDGGPASEAQLEQPHGVVVAPDGTAYFADDDHHVIRRIGRDGIITTLAGTGLAGFSGDGGPATDAALQNPMGLALGRDGTLFVTDAGNQRLRAIAPDGTIRTVAGGGESRVGTEPVAALDVRFSEPHAVALGPDGTAYIADNGYDEIYRLGTDGMASLLAGGGSSSADGAPAVSARIRSPLGLSLGPSGDLYIAEFEAHRVSRVDPSGRYWTVAGTGTSGFSGDGGPAVLAELDSPHTVDVAPDGSLYVTDEGNRRVRRIRPDGYIETAAGSGERGSRELGDGGPPLAANFSQPRVVYVHKDGSLWIADYSDSRIRRVRPSLPGYTEGETVLASKTGTELFVFDSLGRHLRTLDAVTQVKLLEFEYDQGGRLVGVLDRFGHRTQIVRDGAGLPGAIVGPYGERTELSIGAEGYLEAITDAAGGVRSFAYGQGGLLAQMTDPENPSENVHYFEYDALGRLVKDTSPGGLVQSLERTGGGEAFQVTLTTGLGRSSVHEVRDLGGGVSQRKVTRPEGFSMATELAANRRTTTLSTGTVITTELQGDVRFGMQVPVATSTQLQTGSLPLLEIERTRHVELADSSDPSSLQVLEETTNINRRVSSERWDIAEKTRTITSAEGRQIVSRWDDLGRTTEVQRGLLHPERLAYDEHGRVTSVSVGDRVVTFSYGNDGRLANLENALGRTIRFGRDVLGRVTLLTESESSTALGYDASSSLTLVQPPEREAHAFTFLPGHLLGSYVPPAASQTDGATTFGYDADEALTRITQPGARVVDFEHDSGSGRLVSVSIPGAMLGYTYEPLTGRVASATFGSEAVAYSFDGELPRGLSWTGEVAGGVTWTYDENHWLASEQVTGGPSTEFEYDDDGLLTDAGEQTLDRDPEHGAVTGTRLDRVRDASMYSAFGELASYAAEAGSDPLYSVALEHDALGRVVKVTEDIGGAARVLDLSYHGRGWLESVRRDDQEVARYAYDANGNRTEVLTPDGSTVASFDAQDRIERQGDTTFEHLPSGELASQTSPAGTTHYAYDALGNLLRVTLPSGNGIEYVLDASGRRVGKKVDGLLEKGFLYRDALHPVAELDAAGQVTTVFVYASKGNVPDHMIQGSKTYRILSDWLGSVRLVVDTSNGEIAQRLDYDIWGNVTADTNPGFQPFGFAGGLYDPDTGLVRFGARDYDASTGRWTAKDPILFAGRQTNLYVYVGNDPVNFVDPEGRIATVAIGAGIGAVGGAGVALLQGRDAQAAIAGAIGGAVAGGIAGAGMGLGLGLSGMVGAQGFGAGIGGLVGDFINLRRGTDPISPGEVASRFAIRAGFGVLGGQLGGSIGRLTAPGVAGAINRGFNELVVGAICEIEAGHATGN